MILTLCSLLMLSGKGNSMTAEVLQRAAEINADTVMATNQYRINVLAKTEIHPGGFTADT